MKGLIAKKMGMSQIFDEDGSVVPVTILEAGPCYISQIKTIEKDGYDAVQIAYGNKKEKRTNKPLHGHFKKAGLDPKRILAEFEIIPGFNYKMGQEFNASIFKIGDMVKVTGTSKGRGFSGVMKRYCGDELPPSWTFPIGIHSIVFKSDGFATGKGFTLLIGNNFDVRDITGVQKTQLLFDIIFSMKL